MDRIQEAEQAQSRVPAAFPVTGGGSPVSTRAAVWLLAVILAILTGWALHATVWVSMPLAFAFFVALAVAPVDRWVAKRSGFRWIGHLAAAAVIVMVLALFLAGIWFAASQVAAQFQQHTDEFRSHWNEITEAGAASQSASDPGTAGTGDPTGTAAGSASATPDAAAAGSGSERNLIVRAADRMVSGGVVSGNPVEFVSNYAMTILNSVGTTLMMMVLIFFFAMLMLVEAPKWHAKAEAAFPGRLDATVLNTIAVLAEKIRWYVAVRTILGAVTGLLYAAWLWLFGVELVLVWGLLAFLLNFIPTLGSLIAGVLPVVFAFFSKDFGTAVAVAAGILVIEQVMGNFVDPYLEGKQLSVAPSVVLFALLFWGWVWGIAGALIAVPMILLLMAAFAHFPGLKRIALMLSDERDIAGLEEKVSK